MTVTPLPGMVETQSQVTIMADTVESPSFKLRASFQHRQISFDADQDQATPLVMRRGYSSNPSSGIVARHSFGIPSQSTRAEAVITKRPAVPPRRRRAFFSPDWLPDGAPTLEEKDEASTRFLRNVIASPENSVIFGFLPRGVLIPLHSSTLNSELVDDPTSAYTVLALICPRGSLLCAGINPPSRLPPP